MLLATEMDVDDLELCDAEAGGDQGPRNHQRRRANGVPSDDADLKENRQQGQPEGERPHTSGWRQREAADEATTVATRNVVMPPPSSCPPC